MRSFVVPVVSTEFNTHQNPLC